MVNKRSLFLACLGKSAHDNKRVQSLATPSNLKNTVKFKRNQPLLISQPVRVESNQKSSPATRLSSARRCLDFETDGSGSSKGKDVALVPSSKFYSTSKRAPDNIQDAGKNKRYKETDCNRDKFHINKHKNKDEEINAESSPIPRQDYDKNLMSVFLNSVKKHTRALQVNRNDSKTLKHQTPNVSTSLSSRLLQTQKGHSSVKLQPYLDEQDETPLSKTTFTSVDCSIPSVHGSHNENSAVIFSDVNENLELQNNAHMDIMNMPIIFGNENITINACDGGSDDNGDETLTPGPEESPVEAELTDTSRNQDEVQQDQQKIVNETAEGGVTAFNTFMTDMGFEPMPEDPSEAIPNDEPNADTPQAVQSVPRKPRQHMQRRPETKGRKRTRNPELWKSTKVKRLANSGQEYVNSKGNTIPAKKMGSGCDKKCRFKCHEKLSTESREAIFSSFWAIGNHTSQWEFIARHTQWKGVKESRVEESRRHYSHKYFFSVNGSVVFVCRTMFVSTLSISPSYVKTAMKKLKKNNLTISPDKRGKEDKPYLRTPERAVNLVKRHINRFPKVESHYCRKNSKRLYLREGLSVAAMYRLYAKWMNKKHEGEKKVSENIYRRIFDEEFKLSFFKPKKDQCDLCAAYTEGKSKQKRMLQERFDQHNKYKAEARNLAKEFQKKAEVAENHCCFACFDLQKVLSLPKAETSVLYYMRKWSCFNFTVYDCVKHEGHCYFWDESEGKRGANEMASALLMFIETTIQKYGYKHFYFVSDNCSGQNKNRIMFTMYYYAAVTFSITITHLFLQTGHTQTVGDNIHSLIERDFFMKKFYIPEEYIKAIAHAKKTGKALIVVRMKDKIKNFKLLMDLLQLKKDNNKQDVKWKRCAEVSVDEDKFPGKICVRYNLGDEVKVQIPVHRPVRGRPINIKNYPLQSAYDEPLLLPAAKLKDFAKMCAKFVIPAKFHHVYKDLTGFPENVDLSDSEDDQNDNTAQRHQDYSGDESDISTDYEDWVQRNPVEDSSEDETMGPENEAPVP